jgi:ParB family chromosome partitioning protein
LGLNVEIDFNGSGGKVSVKYKTLDQLDDIIRRLSDGE